MILHDIYAIHYSGSYSTLFLDISTYLLLLLCHWCCWDKSVHARAGKCHIVGTMASPVRTMATFRAASNITSLQTLNQKVKVMREALSFIFPLFITSSSRATRDMSVPNLSLLCFILWQILWLFSAVIFFLHRPFSSFHPFQSFKFSPCLN